MLTQINGQTTTGVVVFARPKAAGGAVSQDFPRTQAVLMVTTNDPYPVLGEPLSSPPV